MTNINNTSQITTPQLSPQETDTLLQKVREQIALETFDRHDLILIKQMVEGLGDTRGLIRLGFAESLGQVGTPAVPFLLDALANHHNVVVKRAAAKTLALIADRQTVPNLIHALLHDEDTIVQTSSIGALAKMGEAAVPDLLAILASPENPETIKGHAAWALSFIGVEAKEILYREIASDSPVVRTAVIGALAKVAQDAPDSKVFNIFINSLGDPDETVRTEAAAVLGNLSYQPSLPRLIELLNHADGASRKAAALALMKIGDPSALKPLEIALNQETETGVHSAMKLAISQIQLRENNPSEDH